MFAEFIILAVITIVSAFAIFISRSILKSALALAFVFIAVSAVLLLLGQAVIATIQLFILVGGLSTYIILAVASETKPNKSKTNMKIFTILFIVIFAVTSYSILPSILSINTAQNNIYAAITYAMSQYLLPIYAIILFMFSVAIGSIIIIKRNQR
jgi:NADH:ubiquinone oxidoreductase subunit 6 (subunit J)